MKLTKLIVVVSIMGILANLLFGGGVDKADIVALVKDGALVIDTRSGGEFAGGHIKGAINLPHNITANAIDQHTTDKGKAIVVYCHSGARSSAAKRSLEKAGYTNVVNGGSFHRMQTVLAGDS